MLPIDEGKLNEANIVEIIIRSLKELYFNDKLLLELKVKEECINHRLAVYIEKNYPFVFADDPFFHVDVEYDKLGIERKEMKFKYDEAPHEIRPDIVLHLRGNQRGNILAIEAKKGAISRHDINKLEGFLKPPFNYRFAIGLSYCKNSKYFVMKIISKGQIMKEIKIDK